MRERDTLIEWIAAAGGVVHTSAARAAGFSKYVMDAAVRTGRVDRIRRSWLVMPESSPSRRAAASVSGRVTCLSAAAERGLWVPRYDGHHIAVSPHASRLESVGLHLHRASGPVPVASATVAEPILNVLFHVARCVPRADAMAVWESAMRRKVVDAQILRRVRWRNTRAQELADNASALSDSGTETAFRELMASVGVSVRQQVWVDGHPLDGLIGEYLAIQIDGFQHHSEARDRRRDIRADARLAVRGFTPLRFDYQQVHFDPDYVVETVLTAIAQGLHLSPRSAQM